MLNPLLFRGRASSSLREGVFSGIKELQYLSGMRIRTPLRGRLALCTWLQSTRHCTQALQASFVGIGIYGKYRLETTTQPRRNPPSLFFSVREPTKEARQRIAHCLHLVVHYVNEGRYIPRALYLIHASHGDDARCHLQFLIVAQSALFRYKAAVNGCFKGNSLMA